MKIPPGALRLAGQRQIAASISRRTFALALDPTWQPKCTPLPDRAVLELSGPDAQKFLKGLSSRDVEKLGGGYSGFLNASGRVLHTVFILPVTSAKVPTYLIIYDATNPYPLPTLLPPFKLRSKVKIRDVSPDWEVWSAWGTEQPSSSSSTPSRLFKFGSGGAAEAQWTWSDGPADLGLGEGEVGCWDLRAGYGPMGLGKQVLVPQGSKPSLLSSHDQVGADEYTLQRMVLGVPEGPKEIIPGTALPLESCMDIHGGVDFRKGCYLGQELTVRTYHTGATRKRILPLILRSGEGAPPPGADITYHPPSTAASKKSRSAGKILSTHPTSTHLGLGLVRLEMAERSCWTRGDEEAGRMTISHEGAEWEVDVQQGEAYGAALAQAPQDAQSITSI